MKLNGQRTLWALMCVLMVVVMLVSLGACQKATPEVPLDQRSTAPYTRIAKLLVEGDAHIIGSLTVDGTTVVSGATDLNGEDLVIDADADSVLDENTDDAIRLTLGAASGTFSVLTGNFKVGNGTPDTTQDGEDAYVEGTLEVDGAAYWDANQYYDANTLYFGTGWSATVAGAAGKLSLTVPATTTVNILTGNLAVGNGTPAITQNGEDAYVEGTLEVKSDTYLGPGSSIMPTASITGTSVVFSCVGTLAYTNTTAKGICVVPANANVVDFVTIVTTLFDDTGTDLIDCGFTYADPDEFADALEGQTVGVLRTGSGATMPYASLGDIGAAAQTLWCIYTGQNANSAHGAMTVILYYIVD